MALSTRIEAFKFPDDQPMLRLEARWWHSEDLMADKRFEYSNETGSYTAKLCISDFSRLHQKYRSAAVESYSDSIMTCSSIAILDHLVNLLSDSSDFIKVTVFEWDSACY